MTTATPVYAARTIIAAGTSNAAGGTTRGTPLDLRTAFGGLLTIKITNGATGPTLQAEARVLIAHNDGETPAAAAAGANWKTVYTVGNGVAANTVGEWSYPVSNVQHLEVEITGNTGQAVVCEAYFTEFSSVTEA